MLYPVAIERGDDQHAFGVIVPDLPGCFSAGNTVDAALANAREAIHLHLAGQVEDGETVLPAQTIQTYADSPDYQGFIWALVEIDITRYLGKAEKINITLPAHLIRRIDAFVSTHPQYKSRSGFLANLALDKLMRDAS